MYIENIVTTVLQYWIKMFNVFIQRHLKQQQQQPSRMNFVKNEYTKYKEMNE